MELRQYLDIVRRRKWFIIEAMVVVGVLAGVLSAVRTPVYQASTRVLLRPNDPSEQLNPASAGGAATNDPNRNVTAQRDIAESEAVAGAAARNLRGLSTQQVQRNSSAGQRGASDVLEIVGHDVDPARARDIANEVTRAYIENRRLNAVAGLQKAIDDIGARLLDLQNRIAQLDAQIGDGSTPQAGASATPTPPSNPARAPANPTSGPTVTGLGPGGQPTNAESLKAARYAAATQYESLFSRQQDLLVETNLKRGEAELISLAKTPRSPVSPKPKRDGALGAVVGLLVGMGLAFLREQLDDRIRSADEAQHATNLPVLAELPYDEEAGEEETRLAATYRPLSQLTESFRSLRTSVQFLGFELPAQVILVTSAGPGEGKSLVAANLGAVYAQAGNRTVLVSADLRRPRLATIFGMDEREGGLTSLIVGQSLNGARPPAGRPSAVAALVPTSVPGLLVLVAGPTPPNPAELLGSDRMTEILDELRASADVVIVDSPPLLPVTDAAVLAAKVDAVLLVASLAQTHRDAAKRAVTVLQATGSRLLGMVVNKTTTGHSSYYAGYYGEADEGEKESRRRRKGRKRRRRAAPVPPPLDGEWTPLPTGEPPSAAELPDRPRARARSRLRGR